MSLGRRIRLARERAGKSQKAVADHFAIKAAAVAQWESGDTRPKTDRLADLARLLEVPLAWLMNGDEAGGRGGAAMPPEGYGPAPAANRLARDVPVMGTAVGGRGGEFHLSTEAPIDHVRRPPGLVGAPAVYALYVVGSSMSPRYEEGDLIYVHPHRPPTVGSYVVVQLRDHEPGEHEAVIKRLVRRTATKLVLEQFNPPGLREFLMNRVAAIHRILTANELFGI